MLQSDSEVMDKVVQNASLLETYIFQLQLHHALIPLNLLKNHVIQNFSLSKRMIKVRNDPAWHTVTFQACLRGISIPVTESILLIYHRILSVLAQTHSCTHTQWPYLPSLTPPAWVSRFSTQSHALTLQHHILTPWKDRGQPSERNVTYFPFQKGDWVPDSCTSASGHVEWSTCARAWLRKASSSSWAVTSPTMRNLDLLRKPN